MDLIITGPGAAAGYSVTRGLMGIFNPQRGIILEKPVPKRGTKKKEKNKGKKLKGGIRTGVKE